MPLRIIGSERISMPMRRTRWFCCARAERPRGRRAAEQRDELAALSFDHLVGTREQRFWQVEAECLRGLEVDHQLEFGGLLHRQVGWLLALEDAPDIDPGLLVGSKMVVP